VFAEAPEADPAAKDLNRQFHFRIYECARSPLLLSLMRVLWSSFGYGPQLWRPHETSVMEHRQLVEALAASDVEQAADLTRQHVLGSISWMRARLSADGNQS
jgi:DNA-binding GntR family transcriptional regulator